MNNKTISFTAHADLTSMQAYAVDQLIKVGFKDLLKLIVKKPKRNLLRCGLFGPSQIINCSRVN